MKKLVILVLTFCLVLPTITACSVKEKPATVENEQHEVDTPVNAGNKTTTKRDKTLELTMAHILPASVKHSEVIQKFADDVHEKTGGDIRIKVHPGGQLGGEIEMIEQCKMGSIDAVASSHGSLSAYCQKLAIEDLPYMWNNIEYARAAYDGAYGKYMMDEVKNSGLGFIPITFIEWGYRMITTNDRAITKPSDLLGMKIRVADSPMRVSVFEQYGAQPIVMNFNDVYAALQQGVIDGQENPLATIVSASLWDVQEYLSLTGHFYTTMMVNFNENIWNSLTPEEQEIIIVCGEDLKANARAATTEIQNNLLLTCIEKGFKVIETDEIDTKAFKDAAIPVYEKWFKEVFGDDLTKIYKDASGWEW